MFALKTKNVFFGFALFRFRMNPTKSEFSIRSKIQGLCVRDPELKEFARMVIDAFIFSLAVYILTCRRALSVPCLSRQF